MKEHEVEFALEILHRKIAMFIRNNKEKDFKIFKEKLKELTNEEEKIYNLDEKIIKKTFEIYLKNLKEGESNE